MPASPIIYYPLVEPYDNGERDYLEYAAVCIKLTGFDGVLFDYPGNTPVYDWKLLFDHTNAMIPWLEKAGINFGIVYDDVQGEARLAPVYDLVTTSVYITKDSLALTMNGSTKWPTAKELQKLGETRAGCTPAKVRQILQRIDQAIQDTAREVIPYAKEHPEFAEIGQRLRQQWEIGAATSLRG